jgi:hypothetical protein
MCHGSHCQYKNIQTRHCLYVYFLKPIPTRAPSSYSQYDSYYHYFFLLKIHCAWLLMSLRQLYLTLSVAESMKHKLFLMYLCLVCVMNFSSSIIQNSASLIIYLNETSMIGDYPNTSLRTWFIQQWQEFDEHVLYLMDISEL